LPAIGLAITSQFVAYVPNAIFHPCQGRRWLPLIASRRTRHSHGEFRPFGWGETCDQRENGFARFLCRCWAKRLRREFPRAAGPVGWGEAQNENFQVGEGVGVSQLLVDSRARPMAGAVGVMACSETWRVLRPVRTDWIFTTFFEIGRINQLSSD